MSVDMCDTTVLLVSELVTNAVTHANAPHLSILLSPSGVRVEVGDASQDLPIPRAPDVWREGDVESRYLTCSQLRGVFGSNQAEK